MHTYTTFVPGVTPDPGAYQVYPRSIHNTASGDAVFMADAGEADVLLAPAGLGFSGERYESIEGLPMLACPLTHENALVLRALFPFTAPKRVLSHARTFGVGDRLGLACPGHIRVFEATDALPVFAQQSIRELNLTGRGYEDVLDCVSFCVFREGYTRGFGADGDHLKSAEEIRYALDCGYTMITLDCSEHIRNDVNNMTDEQVRAAYIPDAQLEAEYLNQCFVLKEGAALTFDEMSFKRAALIYGKAIDFATRIFTELIERGNVDFEISIDETQTPTTPLQHFFVAHALRARGVRFETMAPRFCGEFQKGVDYIGDLEQFRREFLEHAMIAKHFGYKISVHSGSDKFAVFSTVGKLTEGRFHVKTAGTNWLEAMKLIAMKAPALYREVHAYALEAFDEARQYYHVTTNLDNIPALAGLRDGDLPKLFEGNDARQLIHITYGLILTKQAEDGSPRYRDRLYKAWRAHAGEYAALLEKHIGRHLALLYEGMRAL